MVRGKKRKYFWYFYHKTVFALKQKIKNKILTHLSLRKFAIIYECTFQLRFNLAHNHPAKNFKQTSSIAPHFNAVL